MNSADKIKKIQSDILNHEHFKLICKVFSEEIWTLHTSNPALYNQIFRESRLNILTIFLSTVFSEEKKTLSDFYKSCLEKGYSSKNKALALLDFFSYSGRLSFSRETDRRLKRPFLTEKGLKILRELSSAVFSPLNLYDPSLTLEDYLSDERYARYYYNAAKLAPEGNEWYGIDDYLKRIYSKSSGMIFLIKIYLDVQFSEIYINSPVRGSYFKNISMDIGVSASHINNLLLILVKGRVVEKKGRDYIISSKFLEHTELFISLYLATIYFFMTS